MKVLGILYGLENYCFAHEVSVITDHKPLLEISKKDVASLSHTLKDTTADRPIQHHNTIYTRGITIHHSLAIQTEPQYYEYTSILDTHN